MRLAASAPAPACLECGEAFAAARDHGAFCRSACRKTFNNRRATRGAELYDLFMACRYDRPAAKTLALWTLLCRAATLFRAEDHRARAGRPSWLPPATIVERRPYLRGRILVRARRSAIAVEARESAR